MSYCRQSNAGAQIGHSLLLLLHLLLLLCELPAGDHLEVLPRNAPALVDAALQLLQLTGQEPIWWTPNSQGAARGLTSVHPTANSAHPSTSSNASSAAAGDAESASNPESGQTLRLPLSSRDVLAWLVDLSAVPPMRMVAMLAAECPCPPEAAQLKRMATEAVYREEVSTPNTTATVAEV
jgi:sulfite reductase alpha subunit-like flavoprotein